MDNKFLHNLKDTPYNERETFNNAILLLSMVKSEYYYIVGFSRPDNIIEIGFDFDDKYYGRINETIAMDFSGNINEIEITTQLTNVFFEGQNIILFDHEEYFSIEEGFIKYKRLFEKDDIVPVSMDKLNLIILSVKNDLFKFIEKSIEYLLTK
ncbi:MAG: hypothetical protein IJZ16_13055 [Clostridia bacterium]|nr:hypothetical protein [Clostridia bacterium]